MGELLFQLCLLTIWQCNMIFVAASKLCLPQVLVRECYVAYFSLGCKLYISHGMCLQMQTSRRKIYQKLISFEFLVPHLVIRPLTLT